MTEGRFGNSPVDRRGARADSVTADQHFALARRVDDVRGRVDSVERLAAELADRQSEQRSILLDRLQQVIRWTQEHDRNEKRKEILASVFVMGMFVFAMSILIFYKP